MYTNSECNAPPFILPFSTSPLSPSILPPPLTLLFLPFCIGINAFFPFCYFFLLLFLHVLVATGEVYSWGSGIFGQLCHGNLRDRFSPLMIGVTLRGMAVTQVACHDYYSAAVTGEGEDPDRVDAILVGGTLGGVYYKHVGLYVIHAIHENVDNGSLF